jgi:hypothetical protein
VTVPVEAVGRKGGWRCLSCGNNRIDAGTCGKGAGGKCTLLNTVQGAVEVGRERAWREGVILCVNYGTIGGTRGKGARLAGIILCGMQ